MIGFRECTVLSVNDDFRDLVLDGERALSNTGTTHVKSLVVFGEGCRNYGMRLLSGPFHAYLGTICPRHPRMLYIEGQWLVPWAGLWNRV